MADSPFFEKNQLTKLILIRTSLILYGFIVSGEHFFKGGIFTLLFHLLIVLCLKI